jgi:hypothetical protein
LEIYQFKVTLVGSTPPIWRRIQVPGAFSLAQLHRALQVAMGWENYHLYLFRLGSKRYGPPEEDDPLRLIDAKRTRLSRLLPHVGTRVIYLYDFGDNWEHELLLEGILMPDPDAIYPRCAAGERRCPPEDVGAISGYAHYLQAMADRRHEDHKEMMMWRGPFDPEEFSVEKVNHELAQEFPSRARTRALRAALATPKAFVNSDEMLRTLIKAVPQQVQRTPVRSGETVTMELNQKERDLIISHSFVDESLTKRLRQAERGQPAVFRFSLDELDELAGEVAAEANHAKNEVVQKQLDALCERIEAVLSGLDDA